MVAIKWMRCDLPIHIKPFLFAISDFDSLPAQSLFNYTKNSQHNENKDASGDR